MISQLKVQKLKVSTLDFDCKHLFTEKTSGEYKRAIDLASNSVIDFLENNKKPFSGISPRELKKDFETIDFKEPLSNYEEVICEVEELYTQHAIAFHLPKYVAHLNCPVVIPAVAAEVLISAINSSLDTWDQSAGGTLIEQKLIQWTCDEIGFDKNADGIFTSGGSQSNLMGLLLARDHFSIENLKHNIKKDGLPKEASRFRIFVSEVGHFSIQKNASLLGLGEQAVIKVKTDRSFRMNAILLEDAIKREINNGNIPIAIVATAGTTDFGNIDPLISIGKLANKYKLWFHVDAAYGGGLLLTDKHRHLINGIEKAHSVTVDYHKTFFQPVSSSAFIVNDKRYFGLITHYADYLNPKDHDDDGIPNQVNKSIQTTRRFDALKLWFTLRLMGKQQLGKYIDKIIETTKEAVKVIEKDNHFELLNHSDLSALVFRYSACPFKSFDLNNINQHIKAQLYKNGHGLVAGTKVNGQFYLKFTILNPMTQRTDIQDILTLIKQYGNDYINFN
ncbi:aspartate aminotransferase family protein [Flavobacterium psychrophilum]|uniref:pyridoxal phosphate-dependent decarboxylase family protein n=3 Tax=Flavobacterium psychrophilum TaxID=96345 RepID=UPI000903C001|nr:aspartate aminotransferase family protein [Flavobacterium psychrophilum]EKT3957102.1 aspartate aminotransferase family protein [Flavobacterium psychrophilum]EKT4510369.1 aspartate aminotransferase family protein [Flavobacterium psychrophilum]ELY2016413.1 aspartate aminotransferase family protein [Flavobacterium psychrophilum]MBF2090990.1 aspartate aminotransferase family protein [Flavobacterium psychrophilum]OJH13318.1 decarboxylase [Flavobacterium psychrophilum]